MPPSAEEVASNVHDLLVIPSDGQLYRAKAAAQGPRYSEAPAPVQFTDVAYRKVIGIARGATPGHTYGPAFSVLPTRDDPASAQICCYLINSENVHAQNPWTVAQWSSEPTEGAPAELPAFQATPLDLLVALGDGTVVRVTNGVVSAPIDLSNESELYVQLRNGLVAGTVFYRSADRVLPIVNLTALI